jgi:phosphatidylserine decarboxylase
MYIYIDIESLIIIPFIIYILFKNKYISLLFFFFILFFLRTPNKKLIKSDPNIFYSPSSGYVRDISIQNENLSISLFLNLFDNHTQYVPINSVLLSSVKKNGMFLPAYKEHSINNEKIIHTFYNKQFDFSYTVTQITGLFTRRIVTFIKENTDLELGDKLGIILLGSRVDITIPLSKIKKVYIEKDTHIDAMTEMFLL